MCAHIKQRAHRLDASFIARAAHCCALRAAHVISDISLFGAAA